MIRRYTSIIEIAVKINLVYRIKLTLYALIGIVQAIIYYFFWNSVYSSTDIINGYNQHEMISYILLSFILLSFMPKWITMEIGRLVRDGSITNYLIKPISIRNYFLFYSFGDTIIIGLLMGVPLFLTGNYLLNMLQPQNLWAFIISTILSIIIVFFISYIIGLVSFWTTNIWGIFLTYETLLMFLSGGLMPVSMFPKWLQFIANLLPFKYTFNVPIDIYIKALDQNTLLFYLTMQMVWILILYFLSSICYKKAIKSIDILGG